MKLEIRVLRPERLSVSDCDVISMMHMQNGPNKNEDYCNLMESSYLIDDDSLDMFKDFRASIYHCFGYYLKAETLAFLEIPCDEEMIIDDNRDSVLFMRPICQRFADQYYSCDKFLWQGDEFAEFFIDIAKQMKENAVDDDAVAEISEKIISMLELDGVFVQFLFK